MHGVHILFYRNENYANSEDPALSPRFAASDQDLHCLHMSFFVGCWAEMYCSTSYNTTIVCCRIRILKYKDSLSFFYTEP